MASRPRRPTGPLGVLASLAFHAALLALLLWAGRSAGTVLAGPEWAGAGTGPTAGPAGGGGGGGEQVAFFEIPATPAGASAPLAVTEPEPEPEPVVAEPEPVVPEPVSPPSAAEESDVVALPAATLAAGTSPVAGTGTGSGAGEGAGTGPGSGGGSGGGIGGGIGAGIGPGTGGGGGEGGSISPPTAMAMIIPPTPPSRLRGRTVELQLDVDAGGRVRDVALLSASGDRGYDARIRRAAREWRFHPARDALNRAVAAQVEVSFSF